MGFSDPRDDKLSLIGKSLWNDIKTNSTGEGGNSLNDEGFHATSYNSVTLEPNLTLWQWTNKELEDKFVPITGILTSNIKYSIESEWQDEVLPVPTAHENLSMLAGVGAMGSIAKSKQYFRSAGYATVNPEIRIIDWDGNGICAKSVAWLTMMCVPVASKTVGGSHTDAAIETVRQSMTSEELQTVNGWATSAAGKALGAVAKTGALGESTAETAEAIGTDIGTMLQSVGREVIDEVHDFITMKYSPPPLIVRVGTIFYHNEMILKSIEATFSNEMGVMGPIYVDISLNLESRKKSASVRDIGLLGDVKKSGGRVKFANGHTDRENI